MCVCLSVCVHLCMRIYTGSKSKERREMVTPMLRKALTKQGKLPMLLLLLLLRVSVSSALV